MGVGASRAHLGGHPDRFHELLGRGAFAKRGFGVAPDAVWALRDVRHRDRNQLLGLPGQRTVPEDDLAELPVYRQTYDTLLTTRAAIAAWRGWLHARQGRSAAIYVPTYSMDIEQAASYSAASTTLTVTSLDAVNRYQLDHGRSDVAIYHRPTATWFYRQVTNVAAGGAGMEVLTLNAALGISAAVGELSPICWLMLSRLESDAVEIDWQTAAAARSTVQFRSVLA